MVGLLLAIREVNMEAISTQSAFKTGGLHRIPSSDGVTRNYQK